MVRYVLDSEVNSAITDVVKVVTVKSKRKPPPLTQYQLVDTEFSIIFAIVFGILGFLIGRAS